MSNLFDQLFLLCKEKDKTNNLYHKLLDTMVDYRIITKDNSKNIKMQTNIGNNSRYNINYTNKKKIGFGGFSNVYKVKHIVDQQDYAIKEIILNIKEKDKILNSLSEVRFLAKLNNKYIVRYHTSWIEKKKKDNNKLLTYSSTELINFDEKFMDNYNYYLYIQFELCHPYTLYNLIREQELNIDINLIIYKQILEAVKYIHDNNIVHRDITLKNIFFKDDCIKLGDFGLSLENNTCRYDDYGSRLYKDPNHKGYTYNFYYDIYSLGIILIELTNKFNTEMERYDFLNKIREDPLKVLDLEYGKIIYKCLTNKIDIYFLEKSLI
jgi:wee1-like protein kinase